MTNQVQIYLDGYNNFCTPGETIRGRVECNFGTERNISAILVRFTGECKTSWTETERYYDDFFKEDRTREIYYSGEEIYFNREFNLSGSHAFTAPPGKHTYGFSFQLPEHLPSSYEGENGYGSIQYNIKATIDSPWKFNMQAIAVLNVISPLDLNFVPRIREPVEVSLDKVLCSLWCNSSDALTFTFSLPCTGFVPGQDVPIGVCVQNLTNTNVQQVKFKITEFTEFIAKSPHSSYKHVKDVISRNGSGSVGAHGEKSWTAVLNIPQSRYFPNLVPCNLINVRYELKGEVVLPCPHSNLVASLPLTIGNVQFAGGNINITLGPPREEATAPSSDSTLLIPALDRRNYGSIHPTAPSIDFTEQELPPSYDEVQKLNK